MLVRRRSSFEDGHSPQRRLVQLGADEGLEQLDVVGGVGLGNEPPEGVGHSQCSLFVNGDDEQLAVDDTREAGEGRWQVRLGHPRRLARASLTRRLGCRI